MEQKTLGEVALEKFSSLGWSDQFWELLAAAVVAAAEARKWKPIEEAPKDRKVELFIPTLTGENRIQHGRYDNDMYASKPRPHWDYRSLYGQKHQRQHQPTMYAELPVAPESTNG